MALKLNSAKKLTFNRFSGLLILVFTIPEYNPPTFQLIPETLLYANVITHR